MKITACPKCGSKNIDIGDMRDGVRPSIEWWKKACRDCGWIGMPLEFETENDYQKFLKGFEKEKKSEDLSIYKDPAESAPIRRYILREFWVLSIALPLVIIPLFIFGLTYEYFGLPIVVDVSLTLLSLSLYIYYIWKKELWNKIKR